LDRALGINTESGPIALYSIMALVNGLYISSHNFFRGLPKGAIFGNFFRSILSIPLAIGFNGAIGAMLGMAGISGVDQILQKWAAVISKSASDFVAGIIEGTADGMNNIQMRRRDYDAKLSQLFLAYAELELVFPKFSAMQILSSIRDYKGNDRVHRLEKVVTLNALDLLYFWFCQPRSQGVYKDRIQKLTLEEKEILLCTQQLLKHEREIIQLLVDGVMGKNYPRPLSFYLNYSSEYLDAIRKEINLRPKEKPSVSPLNNQEPILSKG